jgi:hypothetical protein
MRNTAQTPRDYAADAIVAPEVISEADDEYSRSLTRDHDAAF